MTVEDNILVSVCVVTYNQEKYIAECLESLVSQKTNFKFEIIIGEDCSTDNTRNIVKQYAEKYSDLVIPLFYENNLGPLENIKQVYLKARGKYIAHMDGDDFVLSGKLQLQYDVMEKGYAICSHNVCSINTLGKIDNNFWKFEGGEYNWRFYLKNMPFFAHSSKMFIRDHLISVVKELESNTYDFELHLESLKYGNIYHISDNLGVYRLDVGLMKNDKKILIKMIDTKIRVFEKSYVYFDDKKYVKKIYQKEILKMIKYTLINLKISKSIRLFLLMINNMVNK